MMQAFDPVTIMFGHLIGFTDMCSSCSPESLVACVNAVFTVFDAVVDRYNVFKVGQCSENIIPFLTHWFKC